MLLQCWLGCIVGFRGCGGHCLRAGVAAVSGCVGFVGFVFVGCGCRVLVVLVVCFHCGYGGGCSGCYVVVVVILVVVVAVVVVAAVVVVFIIVVVVVIVVMLVVFWLVVGMVLAVSVRVRRWDVNARLLQFCYVVVP